jgi:hypothetical protein
VLSYYPRVKSTLAHDDAFVACAFALHVEWKEQLHGKLRFEMKWKAKTTLPQFVALSMQCIE